jgi:hypothetical protein
MLRELKNDKIILWEGERKGYKNGIHKLHPHAY